MGWVQEYASVLFTVAKRSFIVNSECETAVDNGNVNYKKPYFKPFSL